jgi:hypothetical protein
MFGRPSKAVAASPGLSSDQPTGAGAQRPTLDELRPVPGWMVPWLLPGFVVFVIIIIGLAPGLVAIALMLLAFAVIGATLYRVNKRLTYEEIRETDPLYRGWDDFRRGRGYRGLDSDGSAR